MNNSVKKKLFFLSDVSKRRTHKYVLASALGVPMLSVTWLAELEDELKKFQETEATSTNVVPPTVFDAPRYSRNRLPVGLSNQNELYILQRSRDAKVWRH